MNTVTFTVPWFPILAALGAVFAFLMARKGIRAIRTHDRIRDEQRASANQHWVLRVKRLFPAPWDEAYTKCSEIYDNPESRVFLRSWLSQQEQELPTLTTEAIDVFARELTFQYCDKWEECLAILAPHSEATREKTEATREKTEATRARVNDLFSYPWCTAYKACCGHNSYSISRHWLRKWIRQQDYLPALSAEAAEELLTQLSDPTTTTPTESYKEATAIVAPYLDVGYSDRRNIADHRLESDLPAEWFQFWKEIKDYPDRRSLFLAKMSRYALDDAHPVFKVPLTSKQAALMARALAGNSVNNDIMAEFYAADLCKCVVMEGEKRNTGCGAQKCVGEKCDTDGTSPPDKCQGIWPDRRACTCPSCRQLDRKKMEAKFAAANAEARRRDRQQQIQRFIAESAAHDQPGQEPRSEDHA